MIGNRAGLGRVAALALMMLSPAPAFAGAWLQDVGQGQAIVTATPSQGNQIFDGSGNLQSIPRYSKDELQALVEYGATKWLTVLLSPSLQHVDIAPPFDAQRTGLGYTDLGARVLILEGSSWVLSGQTTLRIPGTFDKSNPAATGYYDPELDVRALFGYSFTAGSWPSFIDVQVAQRFRFDGPPDEFRADVTLGMRVAPRWLVLAQSFNVISEGAGTWGFPSYAYHKFQLSAVYEVTKQWSVQLGGFTTYTGRNALQENGLVLGAWYKF